MSRALDFFRKSTAPNTTAAPCPAAAHPGGKNNLSASEQLKSSPSCPEPNGVSVPGGPDAQPSRLARPQPEPAPPASGNSGNSGNFLAGSPRENRNFCETDAASPGGSGHKDAVDALRRLKHDGATVTWDGRESRVSFEAVSGADQASLDFYRKAAVKVDAYLAAELPEFPPAEQVRAHRLVHNLAVEVVKPPNPAHAGTLIAELIASSGEFGLALDIETASLPLWEEDRPPLILKGDGSVASKQHRYAPEAALDPHRSRIRLIQVAGARRPESGGGH